MNSLQLSFPRDDSRFDPGAEISLHAEWEFDAPPERLEARLVWHTSGKGDRDIKVVKTITINSPSAKGKEMITFALPWGPYSFSGKLISLIWGVELVAFPTEDSARKEFTLAHLGEEVILTGRKQF